MAEHDSSNNDRWSALFIFLDLPALSDQKIANQKYFSEGEIDFVF